MGKNYYATIASLAWAIGHYFYEHKHFSFLAGEFLPYRLRNPKSSNPYEIYEDLYKPWKDRDDYDKFINQLRLNIRGGVIKKHLEGSLDAQRAERLKRICEQVDITFFYPVVYRVNTDKVDSNRLKVAGSGLQGSSEYLVTDLDESELELLFLDFDSDDDFKRIIYNEYHEFRQNSEYAMQPEEILDILERRCNRNGIQQSFPIPGT
jgi:hypothetical protein